MRAVAMASLVGLCGTLGCMGSPTPLAPSIGGSVGVPHQGVLTRSAPLPKRGPGYRLLRDNGIRYGNPRLVRAIEAAAGAVHAARPGGAPLVIGDLSARHGGASSGHRSHRNGRDADLLFYVTTPSGRPVESPGFLRFGADGLAETPSGGYVRIDLERQWLLIKALVSSPEANVQWLFIARWLEALIIEYARARGDDPELIWYAESVLLQPGDSLSHDDHLHFRVACTPDEAVAGCLGGGPYWPWLARLPQLGPVPDEELFMAIADDLLPSPGIAASSPTAP
jgi:penicillin-insensitive murein endopeptidase